MESQETETAANISNANFDEKDTIDTIMKSYTQHQKEYRKRKRNNIQIKKKIPKTNAQRQQQFRQKQKEKIQQNAILYIERKQQNKERAKRYRERLKLNKQCSQCAKRAEHNSVLSSTEGTNIEIAHVAHIKVEENYGNEKLSGSLQSPLPTDHCHIKTENDNDEEILPAPSEKFEEENWGTNVDTHDMDPLKIEGYIAEGAIIKFEKPTLPKIEVYPKEELPWKNYSDIKSEIDIDEENFGAAKINEGKSDVFTKGESMLKGKLEHSTTRSNICDVCGKSFTQKRSLIDHRRIHTGEKPYSCDICDKSFTYKSSLTSHKLSHTGEKPYSCDICDKSYAKKTLLNKHMIIHTGEAPHNCNVCGKSDLLTGDGSVLNDKLDHSTDGSHICDVCGKSFAGKGLLIVHRRIHTGEKPYNCNICGKSFTQRGQLTTHMIVHTGEKPYSCNVCDKSFPRKQALNKHRMIHTGERQKS